MSQYPLTLFEPLIRRALREDLGQTGDLTTNLLIDSKKNARLTLHSRQAGTIAGLPLAALICTLVDSNLSFTPHCQDGDEVTAHTHIADMQGSIHSLLMVERTLLNFLGHMCGIATLTAQYVAAIHSYDCRIAATRKTLPGLRALQKQAVLSGGGFAHRDSLAAAIMIKDNHIALAGGIDIAMERLKQADHMSKICIEVDKIEQLEHILPHAPDVILFDNMLPDILQNAITYVQQHSSHPICLEASGGITLANVQNIAATGVNVISVGALTHSAPQFDLGLDS